jgi:hypothetical protein
MGFDYKNLQVSMSGGKKTTRKVIIKNSKGYKSVCSYKNGKKCHNRKKHLTKSEIQMIKMGKFIPGLFSDVSATFKKTRKNNKLKKTKNTYDKMYRGGWSGFIIYESNFKYNNLVRVGAGVPNIVYKDKTLNYIVKFNKVGGYSSRTIPFYNKEETSEETIKEIVINTVEELISYIDNNFTEEQKGYFKNTLIDYYNASKILPTLKTFLQFKGIVIYKKIGITGGPDLVMSPAYEYLDIIETIDILQQPKVESMLNIIQDFKQYNMALFFHKDLQQNCRNIVPISKDGDIILKVIDIDKPYILTDKIMVDDIADILTDYVSLINCLKTMKILSETIVRKLLNVDFDILISSFDLSSYYVVDVTTYSSTNSYPHYPVIFTNNWVENKISGTYNGNSISLEIENKPLNLSYTKIIKTLSSRMISVYLELNVTNKDLIVEFIKNQYDNLLSYIIPTQLV